MPVRRDLFVAVALSIRFLTISCLKGLVRARLASTQVLALDSMKAKPTRNFASPLSFPALDQKWWAEYQKSWLAV